MKLGLCIMIDKVSLGVFPPLLLELAGPMNCYFCITL